MNVSTHKVFSRLFLMLVLTVGCKDIPWDVNFDIGGKAHNDRGDGLQVNDPAVERSPEQLESP